MGTTIRRYSPAVLAVIAIAVVASPAQATVTAISTGGSDGTRYTLIDGDAADDSITVTCGADLNVKINGLDPVAGSGTPGPVPIACAVLTSINVDGGAGNDVIDLSAVSRATGFTEPRLCAPCPNNAWAVSVECDENDGNDSIISSPIGGLIGGCRGGSMAGTDVVTGGEGRDAVDLGPGADRVNGFGGNDYLLGGSGNDVIRGGEGRDKLFGEAGADALNGGPDRDRCEGGPGADAAAACEVLRGI